MSNRLEVLLGEGMGIKLSGISFTEIESWVGTCIQSPELRSWRRKIGIFSVSACWLMELDYRVFQLLLNQEGGAS